MKRVVKAAIPLVIAAAAVASHPPVIWREAE